MSNSTKLQTVPDKTKLPPGSADHLGKIQKEKWEIVYIEPFGRCIVAKEDIKEGELLFVDHPVMMGPKQNCGNLCLGCYRELDSDSSYLCSKCGLPMCGKECETNGYHPLECGVFSKVNFKFNSSDFDEENCFYQCILPLRCMLLKDSDPKKWETFQAMESHDELRQGSELWKIEQKNICEFLRDKANVQIGDAQLHSIAGVLDINCHEVKTTVPGTRQESRVRGLYPLCAMMSHDCFSNTYHIYTEDMTMIMIASRDIPKGTQVTGTYTHLLSGTTERRKHLQYGKFFDCVCSRCSDPTELGTYFSALKCSKRNCKGRVICKDPLDANNKADYSCDLCGLVIPVGTVSRLTNLIYYELQAIEETDADCLEELLCKYENLLHPNHFHLVGIKHSLSQIYGRCPGFLIGDLSDAQMERKIDCCRHILRIIDIIDPGMSRLRGLTKYEMHAPLLVKANREFQQILLTREEFLDKLNASLQLLEATVYCLKFESISTHEGQICKIAQNSAIELKQWITTVKKLPSSHFLSQRKVQYKDEVSRIQEELSIEALLRKVASY